MAKERALGTVNVGEYVEVGYSAQAIEKRPFFKELLRRIMEQRDVDYVVIYMRSRIFRNYIEAAIVKQQFAVLGVKVVSAREDFGEGHMAEAMEAIVDVFNWLQVKLNGQDIAAKMLNKAQNGGTNGRAKLGYRNTVKHVDGRRVNTIEPDPDRRHFIPLAFELFATGGYTVDTLHVRLTTAGLTNPATAGPITAQTLQRVLRDPYYIGHLVYKGIEYPNGRHEPLISSELFARVQRMLGSHSGAGTRQRTHNHYLKGLLWCTRCRRRMVVQRAVGRSGSVYFYFFCRGRQDGECDLPYVPIDVLEEAVVRYYRTLLPLESDWLASLRSVVDEAFDHSRSMLNSLNTQYSARLNTLERKEAYLLDLAADQNWSRDQLQARISTLRQERADLRAALASVKRRRSLERSTFSTALTYLEHPHVAYEYGDVHTRSVLNRAFLDRLYIDARKNGACGFVDTSTEPNDDGRMRAVIVSGNADYTAGRIADRLGQDQIDAMVASSRAGTPQARIAEQYNISLSSVKRILRQRQDNRG